MFGDQGSATRCQETAASGGTSSGVASPLSMSITNQPSSALPGFERPRTCGAVRRERQVRRRSRRGPGRSTVVARDRQRTRTRRPTAGAHHPFAVRADRAHRPAPRRRDALGPGVQVEHASPATHLARVVRTPAPERDGSAHRARWRACRSPDRTQAGRPVPTGSEGCPRPAPPRTGRRPDHRRWDGP